MPDGYPVDAIAWTGSLLSRWNFIHDLAEGKIIGTRMSRDRFDGMTPEAIAGSLLGVVEGSETAKRLAARLPKNDPLRQGGFCLASPEFQWRA
jgi:hypothetical protein